MTSNYYPCPQCEGPSRRRLRAGFYFHMFNWLVGWIAISLFKRDWRFFERECRECGHVWSPPPPDPFDLNEPRP